MTKSAVQLAKDFARLQSQVASVPAADQRLLLLVDFWAELSQYGGDPVYQSYFDEYLPLLAKLVNRSGLADLTIGELLSVRQTLSEIHGVMKGQPPLAGADLIPDRLFLVSTELARVYFYAGALTEGLAELSSSLPGVDSTTLVAATGAEDENRPSSFAELADGLDGADAYTAFQTVCARAKTQNHRLAGRLETILTDWQGEREAVYYDRAKCLFVERNGSGERTRGRMRTLVGKVELLGKSAATDEITFDNEIKTPDDPFVGVAYDSLGAVRRVFSALGLRNQGSHFCHAHFSIEESEQKFTGDSLGTAFGLIAFTQLLKPEALRQDRCLSGEVVFTGGVDAEGNLTAVSDESLSQKVERAFFSAVKYLVLPRKNHEQAREQIERLRSKYPLRHLHLVAADTLAYLIEDHNVVRSEKVCIGEFVVMKAAKYGKNTRVQVPLLVVLAYLLLCLIYPKAWAFFSWDPASVEFVDNGFIVYNSDSHELWRRPLPGGSVANDTIFWRVADLDHKGKLDVLVMPSYTDVNRYSGWLFAYDGEGDTLFSRDCAIRGEYPRYKGERDSDTARYDVAIYVYDDSRRTIIIAQTYREYPDRGAIRFLDATGRSLGWYINAGATNFRMAGDINGDGIDEPIFFGYNQLAGCTSIFSLSPDSSCGISPPFSAPELDFSRVKIGNPIRYVMFPTTDVGKHSLRVEYNELRYFFKEPNGEYRASLNESDISGGATVDYFLDSRLRVTRVRLSDAFVKQRRLLVEKQLVNDIPQNIYTDILRDTVTYWSGSVSVTEGQLRAAGK